MIPSIQLNYTFQQISREENSHLRGGKRGMNDSNYAHSRTEGSRNFWDKVFFRPLARRNGRVRTICGSLSFLLIVQNRYAPRKTNSTTWNKGSGRSTISVVTWTYTSQYNKVVIMNSSWKHEKRRKKKVILECLDKRLKRNGGKRNEALKIFLTEK